MGRERVGERRPPPLEVNYLLCFHLNDDDDENKKTHCHNDAAARLPFGLVTVEDSAICWEGRRRKKKSSKGNNIRRRIRKKNKQQAETNGIVSSRVGAFFLFSRCYGLMAQDMLNLNLTNVRQSNGRMDIKDTTVKLLVSSSSR